jgi:hypothetical protein
MPVRNHASFALGNIMRVHYWLIVSLFSLSAISLQPSNLEKPSDKNCNLWKGTASGNDPSVEVQLMLCTEENGDVDGVLQWASSRSGWNRRAVAGTQKTEDKKTTFTLHDERFIENKPNTGWRFCLIDQYTLSQNKETLSGNYLSNDCNDAAKLSLTLQNKK